MTNSAPFHSTSYSPVNRVALPADNDTNDHIHAALDDSMPSSFDIRGTNVRFHLLLYKCLQLQLQLT